MIVLRKARWPMFVIGLISIAIVGYGSAINQPWAAVFGPFSTTLGTMMCFAQWFVPFPVPPLSLQPTPVANRATQPLPHVKTIPQQSQQYSTSFTGPTYGTPNPMFAYGPQKRYIGSGIALWLCVLCLFCETIQYVSIVSIIQATLDAVSIVQNYAIFTILADICFLCGLRGLQEKQAQRVGLLGMVAILAIGTSLLLDILTAFIFLAALTPSQPFSPEIRSAMQTLGNITDLFSIAGFILLGLSFLVGKVYSTWAGIMAIVFGCVNLLRFALERVSAPSTPVHLLLVILGNFTWMTLSAVCGWILMKRLQPGSVYH